MYKKILCAVALSPFLLSAEFQEDSLDPYFEEEVDETVDFALTDEEGDDEDNLSYEEEESLGGPPSLQERDMYPYPDNAHCHSPYHAMHIGVRHSEARGVGYRRGYTTLEAFGMYNGNRYFMPFIDVRGHVFNNGQLAGNVGIGERTVLSSINHLLGIYCYYDVRQDNHDLTVNQISPGFELLGKRIEYRMNGYFPVGKDKTSSYGHQFDRFKGNRILIKSREKWALTGGDAEIGAHITQSTRYDLYAGVGPYYFSASHASCWGGKARLLGRYKEYISLEASYSYDPLFHSVFQGSIGLSCPLGKTLKRKGRHCPQQNDLMLSRAAFAPYRFEIPVVKKVTRRKKAINPATGDPWQVWFVNNTSSSEGTFESPFPTLLQAQNASAPNDMIYVFPGDGTSNGMNAGIALQEGQNLFGSGIPHAIATTKGTVTIPAFSTLAPTVTGFNVITVANDTEVSGMNVVVVGYGITSANPSGGIVIQNNTFSTTAGNGINLSTAGAVTVANNSIVSTSSTSGVGILVVPTTLAPTIADLSNNVVTGFGEAIVFTPPSTPTTGTVVISGNVVSGFGTQGINCGRGLVGGTMTITQNQINCSSGTVSNGIIAFLNNPVDNGVVVIEGNTITAPNSALYGIQAQIGAGASFTSIIANNNVQTAAASGSTGIGITGSGGTMCTSLTGNQVTLQASTGTNGVSIVATGTGVINVEDLAGNVAPDILVNGNVNLVPPGSCNP
jgi:hypothetical protein